MFFPLQSNLCIPKKESLTDRSARKNGQLEIHQLYYRHNNGSERILSEGAK